MREGKWQKDWGLVFKEEKSKGGYGYHNAQQTLEVFMFASTPSSTRKPNKNHADWITKSLQNDPLPFRLMTGLNQVLHKVWKPKSLLTWTAIVSTAFSRSVLIYINVEPTTWVAACLGSCYTKYILLKPYQKKINKINKKSENQSSAS